MERVTDEPTRETAALGMEIEEFRRLGYRAVDLAAEHLRGLHERPVFRPMTEEARRHLLEAPLPQAGTTPEAIVESVGAAVLPYPMGNGHPRFFGWVNSPPAPLGILADLLAATLDPSCAGGDHAAVYVERSVVRWLMELVGFPTVGSMGLLVSGGSMASLTALSAARHRAALGAGWNDRTDGMQGEHAPLVLYLSEEGHSCLRKAAHLLGLGDRALRTVPVDEHLQIDVAALRAAIAADRAAGAQPFCVAASAGTVNTGAIDPLDELADLCAAEGLWLHIDGAYGAVGVLDPAVAPRYRGLERADSLALDPHKWLSIPVECGCVFVRDGALLRDTFSLVPPYLRLEEGQGFGGLPWYSEYGFQQTRGFRALKLWMTLQQAGRDGLAAMVTRHNALAQHLAALIEAAPDLELMAPVTLSIVLFRYAPTTLHDDVPHLLDRLNRTVMERLQVGGEVFLSGTTLRDRFVLRACIIHYATSEDDLVAMVATVRRVAASVVSADRPS